MRCIEFCTPLCPGLPCFFFFRWGDSPSAASAARLLLRHLDQRDSSQLHPRPLGNLMLTATNQQNKAVADVAISHARSAVTCLEAGIVAGLCLPSPASATVWDCLQPLLR